MASEQDSAKVESDPISDSQNTDQSAERGAKDEERAVEDKQDTGVTRNVTGPRWLAICTVIYVIALLYDLDTTIAADTQASIFNSLGDIKKLP